MELLHYFHFQVDSSKRKALTKSGFLYKGQFPNDTGIGLSIKVTPLLIIVFQL